MSDTSSALSHRDDEQLQHSEQSAVAPTGRLLRRPTLAETERIARDCPPEGLSVPVLVQAIRHETGYSRATAYRAVADAFAAGILRGKENAAS
jgi:hypothetical protein